jgi:hypothetical protein
MTEEKVEIVPSRWELLKTGRVQGIGGITGKTLALSRSSGEPSTAWSSWST